jgi:chromosome partitioning protein
MKVLLASGKGGSGKTTSAVMMALALRSLGHSAAIRDLDPQKTASRWLEDDRELLSFRSAAFQITDTAPRLDSPELARAARDADRIVIVSRPSPADLFSGQDTVDLLDQLGVRSKAKLLFTHVRSATILGRDLAQLAGRLRLNMLHAHFALRESYQHAALTGWNGLTPAARREATEVAREICEV